jgi:phosphotransferase system  glucose/maltose/N-acetylglucosamine-specific IIC component
MMFVMTFPSFVDISAYAVKSSHNTDAMWLISIISIAFNLGVFVYQFAKIRKFKLSPLKDEIHTDLKVYQDVAAVNN